MKIDKNIPIPFTGKNYNIKLLETGDSIFIPTENSASIVAHVYYKSKKNNGKFITRRLIENGVKGVRVWRIK